MRTRNNQRRPGSGDWPRGGSGDRLLTGDGRTSPGFGERAGGRQRPIRGWPSRGNANRRRDVRCRLGAKPPRTRRRPVARFTGNAPRAQTGRGDRAGRRRLGNAADRASDSQFVGGPRALRTCLAAQRREPASWTDPARTPAPDRISARRDDFARDRSGTQRRGILGRSTCGSTRRRPRALELGWVDRPTLERYAEGWRTWAKDPDALAITANLQTVGWRD